MLQSSTKNGTTNDEQNKMDWFEEAQDTGGLFPGCPPAEPNSDFGNNSAKESGRTCERTMRSQSYTLQVFLLSNVCAVILNYGVFR